MLTASFCIALSLTDNKYQHTALPAQDGSIVLTEENFRRHIPTFLSDGWLFYSDELLTPWDYQARQDELSPMEVRVGDRMHFNYLEGDRDPHGCGTYRLTLRLPEEPRTYALEVPEIHSAYRLYCNGELIAGLGNPGRESYRDRVQSQMRVFRAGGEVTLTLLVSDYSHFYSGLVYVPAIGTPNQINNMRSVRLSVSVFIASACLLTAMLAGYLGLHMKIYTSVCFALLCLSMALYTIFQILHSACALPVFPWYAIELAIGYSMAVLIVLLANYLCGMNRHFRRVSIGIAAAFCLFSLLYGLFSAHLTMATIYFSSLLGLCFKLAMSGYIIYICFRTWERRAPLSAPLLFASVSYGVFILFSLLVPGFEPIVTGWFPEWGSLVVIIVIGYTLWHEIVVNHALSLSFAEEHRQMSRQLAMQMEYANQLAMRSAESRKLIHDFRQHLRVITELASRIETDPASDARHELLRYLEEFPSVLPQGGGIAQSGYCNRAAVDALLQYYTAAAMRQGIHAQLSFNIPAGLEVSDLEWCTVLGNLLENAVEACCRQHSGARSIVISAIAEPQIFFFKVENSYDGSYRIQGKHFVSSKDNNQGIGLESVRKTVTKHGGTLDIYPLDSVFRVGITLPIKKHAH